jgi:acetoin utilization deacetylase AcuC-like enzyme
MAKYPLVREQLLLRGLLGEADFVPPAEAAEEDLARVHDPAYLNKLASGLLSPAEQRRLGVPWSRALWRRSKLAVQGTLDAARRALAGGISGNLAGGTHHAFADHGEGFCMLNDVAVAIRALQSQGDIARALVVDLDVHQGNGTASIFAHDPSVFTFSMHGDNNYPSEKVRSSLDVGLPDGTDDDTFLQKLGEYLPCVADESQADIVFYLAGVDVARGDRYGRFVLSDAGIRGRDAFVIGEMRRCGLPLTITLAGGYAATPERTAELHAIVFEEALRALESQYRTPMRS